MAEMVRDKRIKYCALDKMSEFCYKFLVSYAYLFIKGAVAAWAFIENQPIIMLKVFFILMTLELLLTRDITPMVGSVFLMSIAVLGQYGSFIDDYISLWPYVVPFILAIFIKAIIFRVRFKAGKLLWCTLAVAITVLISGAGLYPIEAYLEPNILYYYLALSVGVVLIYLLLRNYIFSDKVYNPTEALTRTMVTVSCVCIAIVLANVLPHIIEDNAWYYQWKNNIATCLIFSMPFCFYRAIRCKLSVGYCALGILSFVCICLTMSRGGVLFGGIEFVLCIAYLIFYSRKINLITNLLIVAIFAVCVGLLLANDKFSSYLENLMEVEPNEARVHMFALGLENFLKHPILGHGVPYKGKFYFPQKGAMYWYHNTIIQIMAMTGMVGVVTYGWQYIVRVKTLINRKSLFNYAALISFIGFETMSLVNPGDYTPVPYLIVLLFILVVCEATKDRPLTKLDSIKKTRLEVENMFR